MRRVRRVGWAILRTRRQGEDAPGWNPAPMAVDLVGALQRGLRTLIVLGMALLLLAGATACGGKGGSGTGPAPGPTDIPPPSLSQRPDGLAREFLDHVRQGRYDQAYAQLGSRAQARISQAEFTRQLGEAQRVPAMREALNSRWVQSERVEGGKAIVLVTDRKFPEAAPWSWEFAREGGHWKLQVLYLPPVDTRS